MITEAEWAWAAGFIDGEGCFTPRKTHGGKYRTITLVVGQVRKEPLEKLAKILGVQVRGPYTRRDGELGQKPSYSVSLSGARLEKIIEHLWPHLCAPKREQYNAAIDRINTGH